MIPNGNPIWLLPFRPSPSRTAVGFLYIRDISIFCLRKKYMSAIYKTVWFLYNDIGRLSVGHDFFGLVKASVERSFLGEEG